MMRRKTKRIVPDRYLLPLLVVVVSLLALTLAIAAIGGITHPFGP